MKRLIFALLLCLIASTVEATTYYVSKTGKGTTCSQAAPCLTIAAGLAKLAAGDTLEIATGIYAEFIDYNQLVSGGGSWGTATTIKGATGATVILRPSTGGTAGDVVWVYGKNYIIFDNLTIDAQNATVMGVRVNDNAGTYPHHIRIQNSTVMNAHGNNCIGLGGSDNQEIINVTVHDCGANTYLHHGIYVQGRNNLVERSTVYNISGWGIQQYHEGGSSDSDNIIRYNTVHNTGTATDSIAGGIVAGSGSNNLVYGNVVYNFTGYGIELYFNDTSPAAYNNTIYNGANFTGGAGACIYIGGTTPIAKNNLCLSNATNSITDTGSGSVKSNNVFSTTTTLLTDVANGNFHIRNAFATTLIDQGANLTAVFTADRDGTALPQGSGYDVGAYEYVGPPAPQELVAQYGMDENTAATFADSSGKKNNGSFGAGVTWTTGKYGYGLNFAGTAAATVPDAVSLDLASAFTLEAWVKPSAAVTTWTTIMAKAGAYWLYATSNGTVGGNGAIVCGYSDGSLSNNAYYATPLTANVLSHVACTYDGSTTTLKLYVNGTLVNTQTVGGTIPANANALLIGGSSAGEYFTGVIDEARVYNYARTAAQITTDINTPVNALTPSVVVKFNITTLKVDGAATLKFGTPP